MRVLAQVHASGTLLGSLLHPFGLHFGPFWAPLGFHLEPFGPFWGSIWSPWRLLGSMWASFCSLERYLCSHWLNLMVLYRSFVYLNGFRTSLGHHFHNRLEEYLNNCLTLLSSSPKYKRASRSLLRQVYKSRCFV